MADKMSALAAVQAGYAAGVRPLGIARTFDENARAPVRTSDIVVQATKVQATATTLATIPDGENWRVEYFAAFNGSGGASTIRLFFVPSGGSAGASTTEVFRQSVATVTGIKIDEIAGYNMAPGEKLQAICSTNNDFQVFARLIRITQGAT